VPGAGSAVRMRRKLGDSLGRWLGLTGELLPAERFPATGWLHAVVGAGHGAEEGLRVAEVLAAAAGPAQSAVKQMLAELDDEPSVEAGLRVELEEFARHWSTHDVPAELRRFLARRAAG
jgi:enoyl-CoA hydratase